jgi:hypothetical protein
VSLATNQWSISSHCHSRLLKRRFDSLANALKKAKLATFRVTEVHFVFQYSLLVQQQPWRLTIILITTVMLKSIPRVNKQYILFYENLAVKKQYTRYKMLNVINMKKMYKHKKRMHDILYMLPHLSSKMEQNI